MKKVIALVLALVAVFTLFGCKKIENTDPTAKPDVTAAPAGPDTEKGEGVMTYAQYAAAAVDDKVVIEAYIQDKQSWWQDKAVIYLQDADGGYLAYNMACTEDEYNNKLVKGAKIRVEGNKAEYHGEVEVGEGCTFTLLEGNWIATATDVTALLANEAELAKKMNQFVAFKGMTVEASKDADGNDVAYLYKYNGTGSDGDDLYFKVSVGGNTYTFLVESYLRGTGTDVYEAVKALKVGDKIDMEGYLYWYDGVNPHIISVAAAK